MDQYIAESLNQLEISRKGRSIKKLKINEKDKDEKLFSKASHPASASSRTSSKSKAACQKKLTPTTTLLLPPDVSALVTSLLFPSMASKKEGQPEPDSYLVSEEKRRMPQTRQRYVPGS